MFDKLKSMFSNRSDLEAFNAKTDVMRSGYRADVYMDGDKTVLSLVDSLTDEVILTYLKDMDEVSHCLKIIETDIKNDLTKRLERIQAHNTAVFNKMKTFYSGRYPFIALTLYRKLMSINAFNKKHMIELNKRVDNEIFTSVVE